MTHVWIKTTKNVPAIDVNCNLSIYWQEKRIHQIVIEQAVFICLTILGRNSISIVVHLCQFIAIFGRHSLSINGSDSGGDEGKEVGIRGRARDDACLEVPGQKRRQAKWVQSPQCPLKGHGGEGYVTLFQLVSHLVSGQSSATHVDRLKEGLEPKLGWATRLDAPRLLVVGGFNGGRETPVNCNNDRKYPSCTGSIVAFEIVITFSTCDIVDH